ncbi:ATP-dependent DNA helicase [Salix suchowensis]|nr:ATP-dependent DNA helicase [Salix suchowensis]
MNPVFTVWYPITNQDVAMRRVDSAHAIGRSPPYPASHAKCKLYARKYVSQDSGCSCLRLRPRKHLLRVNPANDAPSTASRCPRPYRDPYARHDLGRMDVSCAFCGALHWREESTVKSRRLGTPEFGVCCDHGKVRLPALQRPPTTLRALLEAGDAAAKNSEEDLCIQHGLAFISLGVKTDDSVNRGNRDRVTGARQTFGGNTYVFRILGQLCRNSAALEAECGEDPSYAQLYLYDRQVALQQRMHRNSTLLQDTMSALQNMLTVHNSYVPCAICTRAPSPHQCSTTDEVAMISPDGSPNDYRDIIVRRRMLSGTRLYEGHLSYAHSIMYCFSHMASLDGMKNSHGGS